MVVIRKALIDQRMQLKTVVSEVGDPLQDESVGKVLSNLHTAIEEHDRQVEAKVTGSEELAESYGILTSALGIGPVTAFALKAGYMSHWLHSGLSNAGYETALMETKRMQSMLKSDPVKTDRRDAEGIAHMLRTGWRKPVHCKSVASRKQRALLR